MRPLRTKPNERDAKAAGLIGRVVRNIRHTWEKEQLIQFSEKAELLTTRLGTLTSRGDCQDLFSRDRMNFCTSGRESCHTTLLSGPYDTKHVVSHLRMAETEYRRIRL